jgi:hypothetical protein
MAEIKRWTGSAWEVASLKYWNGSAWEEVGGGGEFVSPISYSSVLATIKSHSGATGRPFHGGFFDVLADEIYIYNSLGVFQRKFTTSAVGYPGVHYDKFEKVFLVWGSTRRYVYKYNEFGTSLGLVYTEPSYNVLTVGRSKNRYFVEYAPSSGNNTVRVCNLSWGTVRYLTMPYREINPKDMFGAEDGVILYRSAVGYKYLNENNSTIGEGSFVNVLFPDVL